MTTCLIKSIGKAILYTILIMVGAITIGIVAMLLSFLVGYLISLSPTLWSYFHFWTGDKPQNSAAFIALGNLILLFFMIVGIFIAIAKSQYKKCKYN